ncbi:hypothetical protein ACFQYP_21665 [Nonomuraea antimicrobica]
MADGTYVARPIVNHGIAAWSDMAGELDRRVSNAVAEIEAALRSAPWGQETEGRAFADAHFSGNGPAEMLDQCRLLTKEIVAEGDRVRAAVDNTCLTDADMGNDLAAGLAREA